MIYSETIETIYSNVETDQVFSEEDNDYRTVTEVLRATEELELRIIENGDFRPL